MIPPRLTAVNILHKVIGHGASLADALPPELDRIASSQDRAFASELVHGALRHHHRLGGAIDLLMERPLKGRDLDIASLLRLALYELSCMRTPDYAAVSEAVALTATLKKGWAKGLVNGVLRRYLRERVSIDERLDADPVTRHSLPQWLLDRLAAAWPDDLEELCTALNGRAPMTLRVNRMKATRTAYLARLDEAAIAATPHPVAADGITLAAPCNVEEIPGFADGAVSVQDAAAQLAAPLLDCAPGMRVLDACAAPGGKTVHLLECAHNDLDLLAVEIDARRLARIEENLVRPGLSCRLLAADAARPGDWHDGRPFDRILLDAPCSATGVIRRHPDIRVLRRAEDIAALAARQGALLDALWPLLAAGGILLYATCSLLPEENAAAIDSFLARTPDATIAPLPARWGRESGAGRQILAGEEGMDGFYYARLTRN